MPYLPIAHTLPLVCTTQWLDLSDYELELQAYLADLIVDQLVEVKPFCF